MALSRCSLTATTWLMFLASQSPSREYTVVVADHAISTLRPRKREKTGEDDNALEHQQRRRLPQEVPIHLSKLPNQKNRSHKATAAD